MKKEEGEENNKERRKIFLLETESYLSTQIVSESSEMLEQVAQGGCRCPLCASVEGQAG